jgi:hypothetical protein
MLIFLSNRQSLTWWTGGVFVWDSHDETGRSPPQCGYHAGMLHSEAAILHDYGVCAMWWPSPLSSSAQGGIRTLCAGCTDCLQYNTAFWSSIYRAPDSPVVSETEKFLINPYPANLENMVSS